MTEQTPHHTADLRRRVVRAVSAACRRDRLSVLSCAASAGAVAFFIAFLCDYLTHFPGPVRLLLTGAVLAKVAWLAIRWRPGVWRRERDVVRMALRVEDRALHARTNGFGSLLVSALEFDVRPDPNGSTELQDRVIEQAHAPTVAPESVPLHDVPLASRAWCLVIGAMTLYVFWWLFGSAAFAVFWRRAFGAALDYPTRTRIVELQFPHVSPTFEPVELTVSASGELPTRGHVRVTYAGESEFEEELNQASGPGRYTARFEAPPTDIRFRVSLGDDQSEEQFVRIVRPPGIADGSLTVEAPSYTRRAIQTLPIGNADVLENGLVTFAVASDRPVASCELDLGEERHTFVGDGTHFRLENVRIHSSMRYAVRLVDAEGIENRERITYSLRLVRDHPPTVVLERPESDQYWAPVSRLRWRIRATDDHGMVRATLYCQFGVPTEDGKAKITGTKSLEVATLELEPETVLSGVLELTDLGVEPGRLLLLTARVEDTCDFRDAPQIGESRTSRLHVVSPEELRRIIEEEEQQITQTIDDLAADVDRQIRIIEMRQELVQP